MILSRNPSPDKIADLISMSSDKSVMWLKDLATGDLWYWPAGHHQPEHVVQALWIEKFEQGFVSRDVLRVP